MPACRQFTAPRFSLMAKAMAMIATTPATDCRFSMTAQPLFPAPIVAVALPVVMGTHNRSSDETK
jgi:energy-converting hydrogenase Eha subunit A